MTTDIDRKRKKLLSYYDGYRWHEKVAGMSEEQVIAVYLRFERDGPPKKKPKTPSEPNPPDEPEDLRLF